MHPVKKNDLTRGRLFYSKVDGETYKVTHVAKQTVIFENDSGQELSCELEWALGNWVTRRQLVEGWMWYCPTCKASYKKTFSAAVKHCEACHVDMEVIYMMETPTEDALYQEFRLNTDKFYYDFKDLVQDEDELRLLNKDLIAFLKFRRKEWKDKKKLALP